MGATSAITTHLGRAATTERRVWPGRTLLPAPLVNVLATAARRPVLELTGELVFAVVKTTNWVAAEEVVRLGDIQLVLGDGFVVSVDRDGAVLERARQDLEDDPELVGAGLAAVLPCVVDHAAEGYGPVLGALNNAIEEVEEAVFAPAAPRPTERIYRLSRQVLEFRRAVAPLTELLDRLAAQSSTAADERLQHRYRERRAHLLQLVELADGLGNLLSNVLQANLTEVSVRQNDDMRRISAWVTIWVIPTLLAGIYGMTFRHLPELEWVFGYPLVVMALICLGLYPRFRRSGWL
jgi:magnesium transporter